MEGHATIANPVFVAALVAGSVIAEQNGTGGKHAGALGGAILERPLDHRRDAHGPVLFLERCVGRARRTDHIAHAPARTGCQQARIGASHATL